MPRTVVVAIDGSLASAGAVRFAAKVAKATGWELVLLHILEGDKASTELGEGVRRQRLPEPADKSFLQSKMEEVVRSSAPELWMSGIRYSTEIEVGDPREKIVDLSRRIGAEMIVVGFEGLRGVGKIRALGSISRAVTERSEIPVVVVPEPNVRMKEMKSAQSQ